MNLSTKQYKKPIVIALIVAIILLGIIVYCVIDLATPHQYGSFTTGSAASSDGMYIAKQRAVKPDGYNVKMVKVDIYDAQTEKLLDSFIPARAMDFLGICWEEDTHNIWTQSSDIGIYCYTEIDGKWICDEDAIMPDSIVTKYDTKYGLEK